MTATPHPDLDRLAEYDADALGADDRAAVAAHVDGCGQCRESLGGFAATRTSLGTLAHPELPRDVALRLDTALAQTGGIVVPLRQRRRLPFTFAGTAAAAVALMFVAALGIGLTQGGNDSDDSDTSAAGGAAGADDRAMSEQAPELASGTTVLASGRDYRSGTVQQVLDPAPATAGVMSEQPPELARLRDAAPLEACLRTLTQSATVTPVVLDYARYEGRPALVAALATRPGELDIWVVGPDCAPGRDDARFFIRVPRPAS